MSAVHTPPVPPASVIARCAATDDRGPYGGCHGANASGANDLAAASVMASLAELSASMQVARAKWEAGQVTA